MSADWKPVALCSNHFAVLYSGLSKTPLVTFERLNRAQIEDAKDEQRTDQFFPDPRLPRGVRAELDDYRGSGLDRGHLAPAGDQPDQESMAQSFALSNMVPQDQTNNRKIWSKIEGDVRKFVRRAKGDVYVFSGPIFNAPRRTIGAGRVWVPSHMFKLVYDEASGRSWAYILPNTADARIEAPMDYQAFVKATGWNLLSAVHAVNQ
ncbi:DNA/RNA non-specific endonuclease [Variovorax sp. LjRoot178]|uniref:DNA/RNA non-specific endonuclease n=1 Tax=Variovorax sp. LjRoot178 TaxID=3342277 RepID=UPI003ECE101C